MSTTTDRTHREARRKLPGIDPLLAERTAHWLGIALGAWTLFLCV